MSTLHNDTKDKEDNDSNVNAKRKRQNKNGKENSMTFNEFVNSNR